MLQFAAKPSPHAPVTTGQANPPPYVEPPLVERMARRMLEMGMNGNAVTADSLFENSDFTRDEIKAAARDAADLARAWAVRRVA